MSSYPKEKQVAYDLQKAVKKGIVLEPTVPIVYSNYKEPLSAFVKEDGEEGFGYKGVLAMNKEGTHVQCHICGYFFKSLGMHVAKIHGYSSKEYKKAVGLLTKTSLVAEDTRLKWVKNYDDKSDEYKLNLAETFDKYRASDENKKSRPGTTPWALERRNLDGTCPDQLLQKLRDVSQQIGKSPEYDWFKKKYPKYLQPIMTTFGKWSTAKRLAGLEVYVGGNGQVLSDGYLLECLRTFFDQKGRTPVTSDFSRGFLPSVGTYYNRYGNLNNARAAAGIPQTVQIGYGRFIEV